MPEPAPVDPLTSPHPRPPVARRPSEPQGIEDLRLDREKAFVAGMTKTENRAAAKAFRQQRDQERHKEWHAQAVAADLEELRRLRHYLIFNKKAGVPHHDLTKAIDDYVEKLTGDRRTLHGQNHSIG